MAPFDELQTLWQSQNPPPPAVNPAALAGAFRRLGRKHDLINIAKALLLAAALVNTVIGVSHRPLVLLTIVGILSFGVIALVVEWRIQRGIARLNFSACSVDFVRDAIARMQAQRNPYHTPAYFSLLAAVLVGYNLIVYSSWTKLSPDRRVLWHVVASTFPAVIYVFGRWVRAKRFNAEYLPLIQRLNLLLEVLEEDSR
jgi:hypothetical protein